MSSILAGNPLWYAMSDPLLLILVLGFLLLFALVIVWMISSDRKRRSRKVEQAQSLGFQPVEKPDPALTNQILALHIHRAGQQREIRNLFFRRTTEGDVYLFDLWDPSGDSSTQIANSAVAVLSPNLRLPRFALISRLEETGSGVAGLLSRAANWAIRQLGANMWMIAFADDPDFSSHFFVAVPDETSEPAVRAFLNADLRCQLLKLVHVHIQAGGNLFTISSYDLNSAHDADQAEKVREQIRQAQQVARLFEDVPEQGF